jgi:hypothetical protein
MKVLKRGRRVVEAGLVLDAESEYDTSYKALISSSTRLFLSYYHILLYVVTSCLSALHTSSRGGPTGHGGPASKGARRGRVAGRLYSPTERKFIQDGR